MDKDIIREARELSNQMNAWLTGPAASDPTQYRNPDPALVDWCRCARDVLVAVAAQDPQHPMHETYVRSVTE